MSLTILGSLALCFIYAFARYVAFGGVSLAHTPAFIVNKAVAMAAALFLMLSARAYLKGALQEARTFGVSTAHCAFIHAILSFVLLRPSYFPGFFQDDRLTALAEAMLFFGALTAYFYGLLFLRRPDRLKFPALKAGAAAALAAHVLFLGLPRWARPADWPAGMPNVSLISFAFATAALLSLGALFRRRAVSSDRQPDHKP